MALTLFSCTGGCISLPERSLVLADRLDGGNLLVSPPRDVWERSELTLAELSLWSCLVAAAGRAMIEALPQLEGGCVNYWEAGNWALHSQAEPVGAKTAPIHRKVHLHLIGRSRHARQASYQWGEAPKFPDFVDRHAWASRHHRLTGAECTAIVSRVVSRLLEHYGFSAESITLSQACLTCGYPVPAEDGIGESPCLECQAQA